MKPTYLTLLALTLSLSAAGLAAGASSGRVISWGMNIGGSADAPRPFVSNWTGVVSIAGQPLRDIVAVAAGSTHALAVRADGTVEGWGYDYYGQGTGFGTGSGHATNGFVRIGGRVLSNVIAVAAGDNFSLALKTDGTVVGWGDNRWGQTAVPADLKGVTAVAAGKCRGLALRGSSGLVILSGQVLTNVVAVAAGNEYGMAGINSRYSLALRKDGTVVAWGCSDCAATQVPAELTNVTAIAAGQCFSLAIKKE